MAVDKAALKMAFCPKFKADKLVCVFKAASSYSETRISFSNNLKNNIKCKVTFSHMFSEHCRIQAAAHNLT